MENKKRFVQDARSFYNHRCGPNAFSRASNQSNDPLEVYNNHLNKYVMKIIIDSARNEYFIEENDFDIISLFLKGTPHYYSPYSNRIRSRYRRNRSERTKFRQPKGAKIAKKEKEEFKDRLFPKDHRKNHRSRKWIKKCAAKKHRAWVREKINKVFIEDNIFSVKGDNEYKQFQDRGWW